MTTSRAASFLLAAASLGSLIAATASRFIPAAIAAALALAASSVSWVLLGRREAREAQARIEILGQPYLDVLAMLSGGVVRRAYARGMEPDGQEEAAA